jgi:hypothetical protein
VLQLVALKNKKIKSQNKLFKRVIVFAPAAKTSSDQVDTFSTAFFSENF